MRYLEEIVKEYEIEGDMVRAISARNGAFRSYWFDNGKEMRCIIRVEKRHKVSYKDYYVRKEKHHSNEFTIMFGCNQNIEDCKELANYCYRHGYLEENEYEAFFDGTYVQEDVDAIIQKRYRKCDELEAQGKRQQYLD